MSNAPVTQTNVPALYDWTRDALVALAAESCELTTNGPEDTKALKAVTTARITLKNTRVAIDKRRKELKEESLRTGQAIDSVARDYISIISVEEQRLKDEEQRIVDELNERKRAAYEKRATVLRDMGADWHPETVQAMTDDEFTAFCAAESERIEQERIEEEARVAEQRKEDEARAAAQAKLDADRAEFEAQQAQAREEEAVRLAAQREAQAKIDAENKRLDEVRRAAEDEKRREEDAKLAAERKRLADIEEANNKEAARLAEERRKMAEQSAVDARDAEAVARMLKSFAGEIDRAWVSAYHAELLGAR